MDIINGKKGVMFTILAIFFVFVILIAFVIQLQNTSRVQIEKTRVQVETMNNFVGSLKTIYIPVALKTSLNRAFEAAVACISSTSGNPTDKLFNNVDLALKDAMVDGVISDRSGPGGCDSVVQGIMKPSGEDFTLYGTFDELVTLAAQTGIILTPLPVDKNKIVITQTDPWNVEIHYTVDFVVGNEKQTLSWNRVNVPIEAKVSIIGINDPLVVAYDEPNAVSIEQWDGVSLDELINLGEFNHPDEAIVVAPSFLERFDSNWESIYANTPCCGIESLRGQPGRYSWVDYLFFSQVDGTTCGGGGGFPGLKLDDPHKLVYSCGL